MKVSRSDVRPTFLLSKPLTFDENHVPIIDTSLRFAEEFGLVIGQRCALKRKVGDIVKGTEVVVCEISEKQRKGQEKVTVHDKENDVKAAVTIANLHYVPHGGVHAALPSDDSSDDKEPDAGKSASEPATKKAKTKVFQKWDIVDKDTATAESHNFVSSTLYKLMMLQGVNSTDIGIVDFVVNTGEVRVLKSFEPEQLVLVPYTNVFLDKKVKGSVQVVMRIENKPPMTFVLGPCAAEGQVSTTPHGIDHPIGPPQKYIQLCCWCLL